MRKGRSTVMLVLLSALLLFGVGCAETGDDKKTETWSANQTVKAADVREIVVGSGDVKLLDRNDIEAFMSALGEARYDPGKLDIKPADTTVKLVLNSGDRSLSLWFDGGYIVDHNNSGGHYILAAEALQTVMKLVVKPDDPGQDVPEDRSPDNTSAGTKKGDFRVRIETDKTSYRTGEPVKITASLHYEGDNKEMEIWHAASPLAFHVTETKRKIDIPSPMTQPLKHTKLVKGEPFKETFGKSGAYSKGEPNAKFIQNYLEGDGFPAGEYEIRVMTDFYTEEQGKKREYNFSALVNITVN